MYTFFLSIKWFYDWTKMTQQFLIKLHLIDNIDSGIQILTKMKMLTQVLFLLYSKILLSENMLRFVLISVDKYTIIFFNFSFSLFPLFPNKTYQK